MSFTTLANVIEEVITMHRNGDLDEEVLAYDADAGYSLEPASTAQSAGDINLGAASNLLLGLRPGETISAARAHDSARDLAEVFGEDIRAAILDAQRLNS